MLDGSGQIQSVHGLFSDFVLRQRRVARLCRKKRIGKLSLNKMSGEPNCTDCTISAEESEKQKIKMEKKHNAIINNAFSDSQKIY